MPLRPCLTCGALSPGPRCPTHTRITERERTQSKRVRRPYTHSERVRRAAVVAEHRATQGDVCPGWRRLPHPAQDLTADHPHAVGAGGHEQQSLTVLCRSCNSAKGAG